MLAKFLKRKESRHVIQQPQSQEVPEKSAEKNGIQNQQITTQPLVQYRYQRPDLLGKLSENDLSVNSNQNVRPVVVPKSKLVLDSIGYAEVMNAGKSRYNEDQCCIFRGQLWPPKSSSETYNLEEDESVKPINYLYIGLFDGHGGPGCALKASKELQQIVHEGLDDALEYIVKAHKAETAIEESNFLRNKSRRQSLAPKINGIEDDNIKDGIEEVTVVNGTISDDDSDPENDNAQTNEVKMTLNELISGALESAFWAMDKLIVKDREAGYRISGGSCALVILFIFNRIYVANAGDCRACIYNPNEPVLFPMSFDFTPESDRQRIQLIAYQRPELLRHPITREKLYNRHVLSRKVKREEVGIKTVMYRDFYMAGWSCRDVTSEDVRLIPLISGRGKQCRLMGTVGVARGLGDHDLIVKSSLVNCKEFLSCQPEVRVKCIDDLHPDSVLILASDGLWDVLSNANVYETTKKLYDQDIEDSAKISDNLCHNLVKKLVIEARGVKSNLGFWHMSSNIDQLASGDDITCLALPITKANDFLK